MKKAPKRVKGQKYISNGLDKSCKTIEKIMFNYLVVYLIVVTGLSIVDTASVRWRKSSDSWFLKRLHKSTVLLGMHAVKMIAKRLLRLTRDWVTAASSILRLRC